MKVLYFASVREAVGTSAEELPLPAGVATLGDLRDFLAGRGGNWAVLTQTRNLRGALNQRMVGFDAAVSDADEAAFFPPVTGG